MDLVKSPTALRRWTIASLVANMALIVTGGLVRLTKSGLGCPTWPQCESGSYVPYPESGIHGLIEFGNRLLTFALAAIAIGTLVAAWKARRDGRPRVGLRWMAALAAFGIPLQAVVGGWSVLSGLNPWVVALHLVLSIVIIALCVAMIHQAYDLTPVAVAPTLAWLVRAVFVVGMLVIWLGTVVTGAGPHSGDGGAQRSGLDLTLTARIHAGAVWLLVLLTVVALLMAWGTPRVQRALVILLVIEAVQGLIGYVQFFTALPVALVTAHMLGTALFAAAVTHVWLSVATAPSRQKNSGSSAAAMNTTAR